MSVNTISLKELSLPKETLERAEGGVEVAVAVEKRRGVIVVGELFIYPQEGPASRGDREFRLQTTLTFGERVGPRRSGDGRICKRYKLT
jgi:hypothetical protein